MCSILQGCGPAEVGTISVKGNSASRAPLDDGDGAEKKPELAKNSPRFQPVEGASKKGAKK